MVLLSIYRPGSAPVTNNFFDELETIVCAVISMNTHFVIVGIFNIHVDVQNDSHGTRLRDLFDAHGLIQHVNGPTHDYGHTLDFVITAETSPLSNLEVRDLHACQTINVSTSPYHIVYLKNGHFQLTLGDGRNSMLINWKRI